MKIWGLIGTVMDSVLRVLMWALIVYYIYTGAQLCYDYGYRIFTEPAMSTTVNREVEMTIPADFSAKQLGEMFAERGLTRDALLFTLQYYASEYKKDVKGGTYTFSTLMTAEEMFAVMAGEGSTILDEDMVSEVLDEPLDQVQEPEIVPEDLESLVPEESQILYDNPLDGN